MTSTGSYYLQKSDLPWARAILTELGYHHFRASKLYGGLAGGVVGYRLYATGSLDDGRYFFDEDERVRANRPRPAGGRQFSEEGA